MSITINGRGNLAGDMNNDGVRDLGDVSDLAHAFASPSDYLTLKGGLTTGANSTVNDGSSLNSTVVSARAGGLLGAAPSTGVAGLIVLTDLNSDGNVVSTGPGTFAIEAVSRADVRYFLYGAAIDTTAFTGGNTTLNGATIALSAAQDKRENGVRLGDLKKNAAIDTFNARLDALVDNGQAGDIAGFTQAQADAKKFNKHDVDNDTFADAYDAVIVDRNFSKNFTTLADVLGTNDDLVAAELNDDKVINAADVAVMNSGLTGVGKTNWRGGVLEKTGPGTVTIARSAGVGSEVTLPAGGQTLQISAGSFSAGGTADPFTDTAVATRHVGIENNSIAGTGGFNISGGSKTIAALTGTGKTFVSGGASLTTNSVRQSTLNVDGQVNIRPNGNNTSVVGALAIGPDGRMDLSDNELITTTPVGIATNGVYDGVQGEVQRAYNFSAWDLPGLMTSQEQAGPTIALTTIGVATGEQVLFLSPGETGVWAGETITSSTTIAMYTYAGDVDLNGLVDAVDYGTIDNWIQFPGTAGYTNGDLNYDGVIDAVDYGIIDNSIQLQGPPLLPPSGSFAGEGSGLAANVTAVPEPATAGLIFLSAMGISLTHRTARRRRRADVGG